MNSSGVSDPRAVLELIKQDLPKCLVITDWPQGPTDYSLREY